MGEGPLYYEEAGYVDFTGPDINEEEGTVLQKLGLKDAAKNTEDGWYSNLVTMRVYFDDIYGYTSPELPEFVPGEENLVSVAELEWQDNRLTAMVDYFNYGYYTTTPYYYSGYYPTEYYTPYYYTPPYTTPYYYTTTPMGAMAQKLPIGKTEYVYEPDTENLERVRSNIWNGEGFDYTDVSVYGGYDSGGNPEREIYYWVSRGSIPQDPDINGTAEVVDLNLWGGEYWPAAGDYIEIYSPKGGYYVWFTYVVDAFDPAPAGLTGIPASDTGGNIMEIIANAINSVDDFTAEVTGSGVLITNVMKGDVPDANYGNVDSLIGQFTITQGSPAADTTKFLYEYDAEGRLVSLIIDESPKPTFTVSAEKHTFTYDEYGSIKTLTISFYDSEGEAWEVDTTLTFNVPEGIPFNFDDLAPWTDPIGNMIIGTLLPD
jgi:hypothetical protein